MDKSRKLTLKGRALKTTTFTEGGITFTIPFYMTNHKKEIADWAFKKFLQKLEPLG